MGSCPLFPVFSTQAFLRVWQMNYCEGEFTRCARFQAGERGERVPATLLPNGKHLRVLGHDRERTCAPAPVTDPDPKPGRG